MLHKNEDVVCGMDFISRLHSFQKSEQKHHKVHDFKRRFLASTWGWSVAKFKVLWKYWRWSLSFSDYLKFKIPVVFHNQRVTLDLEGVPFSYNVLLEKITVKNACRSIDYAHLNCTLRTMRHSTIAFGQLLPNQ